MIRDDPPDVMTPEQVAAYLQLDRETIYRYIRSGQLVASQFGRNYRIPRRSVDLLLWSTRTRPDITLREYTGAEIEAMIAADQLDPSAGSATAMGSEPPSVDVDQERSRSQG